MRSLPDPGGEAGYYRVHPHIPLPERIWSRIRKAIGSAALVFSAIFPASAQTGIAEYFFDTDPGIGNGVTVPVAAGDSVVLNRSVPVTGLSTGFHTIYIRTRLAGRWSLTSSLPFFIVSPASLNAGPVSRLEYFFDSDPGPGRGTQLSLTASDSLERVAVVPVSSLGPGFHSLYVRSRNNAGFSQTESRPFFIVAPGSLTTGPVTRMEYFFDSDPGPGRGTQLSLTASDSLERVAVVPISGLSPGFHNLYVRSRNNAGFSQTETRPFFIVTPSSFTTGPVTRMEYFFDSDPGPGRGTQLSLTASDSLERVAVVPVSGLSPGFHNLYVRARNSAGFSQTETRPFFIVSPVSLTAGPVTRMEYFFDSDPGPGRGTQLSLTASDSLERVATIPVSGLSPGFHTLYVRSRNNSGYSQTEAKPLFVINPSVQNSGPVSAVEYFIDTDPGFGQGIPLSGFSPGDSVSLERTLVLPSDIGFGPHILYTRSRGTDGKWSQTEAESFTVACGETEISSNQSQVCPGLVTRLQFVPGNLPGTYQWIRNGQAIAGATGFSLTVTLPGSYRLLYSNGTCSDTSAALVVGTGTTTVAVVSPAGPLDFCASLTRTLSANTGNGLSYVWLRNGLPVTGQTGQTFAEVSQPGTYSVVVTNATGCRDTSDVVVISNGNAAGNPENFPQNSWNLNAYSGADLNLGTSLVYRGFYSVSGLSINTGNDWPAASSPSSASGYQGCVVPSDNFTFVLKRRGFAPGPYTLTLNDHDDQIRVLLNGSVVFENLGCCSSQPPLTLGTLDAASEVEIRVVEFSGFSRLDASINLQQLNPGVVSGGQVICTGTAPALFASSAAAFGGPTRTITYQWEDSIQGGSWQSVSGATSATFQAPVLTQSRWYRRRATNGTQTAFSNILETDVRSVQGDPLVFPSQTWHVYAYSGTDIDLGTGLRYSGFYSISSLNADTRNQWDIGSTPFVASGYAGCPVPADAFTLSLRREGFPQGEYTLTIPFHDDRVRVILDGNTLLTNNCCNTNPSLDLGNLGPASRLEIRLEEGGGNAGLAFILTSTAFQGGEISGSQSRCSPQAVTAFTSLSPGSGGGAVTVTYQWQDSVQGGSWQNIAGASNLTFTPASQTGIRFYRRRASSGSLVAFSNILEVRILEVPVAVVSPSGPLVICQGELAELTVSVPTGVTTGWLRNGVPVPGQISATLFPGTNGSYQAVLTRGGLCADTSNAVLVTVNPAPNPQLDLSGPQTRCAGQTLTLTHSNPQPGQSIIWKKDGFPVTGGQTLTVDQPGTYYLVAVVDQSGCRDSTGTVVLNLLNPQISPSGVAGLCAGQTRILSLSGAGAAGIQWLRNGLPVTGATASTLDVSEAGSYTAVVDVPGFCTDTAAPVVVQLIALPDAQIQAEADSFCSGGSTVLRANTGAGLGYQWKRNGINISGATLDSLVVSQAGSYTVEVRNAGNCSRLSGIVAVRSVLNTTWFLDRDEDGYGNGTTVLDCSRPAKGFLAAELQSTTGDCNDLDPTINPGRQFFSFAGGDNFTSALCSPLQGTPYTTFRFEVVYTDLNDNPPPPTFPRTILDFEGNGQLNNGNDRTILMQESDSRDDVYSDGKKYFTTVNSLPSGQSYTTRVVSNIGTCGTTIGPLNQPDVFILSDLQIFANDIVFDNPNPEVSSPLQITATVHNVSDFAAQNVVVHLRNQFDSTIVYPDITIPFLSPQSSINVVWNILTPSVPAWCPMQVFVDWTNVITETNELDNSAIRPFINGNFNVLGAITFSPSISPGTVAGISGATVTLTGTANYTNTAVPLQNPGVAGAQVTFTIQPGGQSFTTYTNAQGQINFSFAVGLTPGVYTVTGTITDFTLTTTFTTTFTVVPPVCLPDLTAKLFFVKTNLVEGESTNGFIRIRNSGCQNVTDSTVVTISQSGGLPLLENVRIGPLAVGQEVDIPTGDIQFPVPGTFSLCATADGEFQIEEAAEFNNQNCAIFRVIPFLPDIVATTCGIGGTRFISPQPQSISFGATNTGGSATGPFTVRVRILRDGNVVETRNQPIANIASQGSVSFPLPYTFDTAGVYSFQVYWDSPEPAGIVAETDETNNVNTCSVQVLVTQADLVVFGGCENIDADPNDPSFPGNVTLRARISNSGNADVLLPVLVRFIQSGGAVHEVTIPEGLAAGATIDVLKTVPSVAPATETLRVEVDPLNTVPESRDDNNTSAPKNLCHEFAPVDNICGFNWWSGTYRLNQAIFLNVPIQVSGIYDASQLKVRFLVSGPGLSGTLNLGDAILTNVTETCSCPVVAVLPTSFAFPQEGEYTFTFVADPEGVYTECDEANNTLVRKVQVSGLPDMRVLSQGINPTRLNPDVNESILIQANYENIGLSNINQTMKFKLLVDEVAIDSAVVNGLVTGDNFTVNFPTPWSSDVVGSHIIRTVIDAGNLVPEANEANNEATRAVIVGAAANLYFQVFQPSVSSPAIGQNIQVTARIGNNGDEDVNAVVQLFYITNQNDTIQIGQAPVFVAGNDSTLLQFPWAVTDNNTVLIGRIVNADIMEFNYEDNQATAPIGGFAVSVASSPACDGISGGSLTLTVAGGSEPFSYFWSNGFTGKDLLAAAGTYTVQVRDANGVTVQAGGVIGNRQPLVWYRDSDLDGYGNPGQDSLSCDIPQGYVRNNLDCDDQNPTRYRRLGKPVIEVGGELVFCPGSSVLLSVDSLPGLQYAWSTGQAGDSVLVTVEGGITVTASADSACPATSEPVQTQVVTSITPLASIASGSGTQVCTGTPVTFTSQVSGGGSSPLLEWFLNGTFVESGPVYATDSLRDGDEIQLLLTSSETCATPEIGFSNILVMDVRGSIKAEAGPDQTICGTSATLAASGTGTWALLSGTGTFAAPQNPQSAVTGLSPGLNLFIWTLEEGLCPSEPDTVAINSAGSASTSQAGPDQQICDTVAFLDGNSPVSGTGTWSLVSGSAVVLFPGQFDSPVQGLAAGETRLEWVIRLDGCPESRDTVRIFRFEKPGPAIAGSDLVTCGDSAFLNAQAPAAGNGVWQVLEGQGQLADSTSAVTRIRGLLPGQVRLVWKVRNAICAPVGDTLVIEVLPGPSQALAGSDQTICAGSLNLAAVAPSSGQGVWRVISGTGVLADSLDPASTLSNIGPGTTQLAWVVQLGSCLPVSDTVSITRRQPVSPPQAGTDQLLCGDSTRLAAGIPATGTGVWRRISGSGILSDSLQSNASLTSLIPGISEWAWVVSNDPCPSASDTVRIEVLAAPSPALAGSDLLICDSVAGFNAQPPLVGTGLWTRLSGSGAVVDAGQPSTQVSGFGTGESRWEWSVSNGACPVSRDTLVVTRRAFPSPAQAGSDQEICGTTVTLSAGLPVSGTGRWRKISGTGTLSDSLSSSAVLSALSQGISVWSWVVENAPCAAAADSVQITAFASPGAAIAGSDTSLCDSVYALQASAPLAGSGAWTVVTGTSVPVEATNPGSVLRNLGPGLNELVWTVGNGVCPVSRDTVRITRFALPDPAFAGKDSAFCGSSITLYAQAPVVGAGMWEAVTSGLNLAGAGQPGAVVSGLQEGLNVLVWKVSNGVCPPSTDTLRLSAQLASAPAIAGGNQLICDSATLLDAQDPAPFAGSWSLLSGSGVVVSPAIPGSPVNGLGTGLSVFVWTVDNGLCPVSRDTVTIDRSVPPGQAQAGQDFSVCSASAVLSGNTPLAGFGEWTVLSGNGTVASPNNPSATVSNLSVGETRLIWTLSSGTCPSTSDTVTITRQSGPSPSVAGPDQVLCNPVTAMAAQTPSVGTGVWTVVSGTAGIAAPALPGSQVSGLQPGQTVLVWTVSSGVCPPSADTVVLTYSPPPPADAGPSLLACSDTIRLNGVEPGAPASGLWTLVEGGGVFASPSLAGTRVDNLPVGQSIYRWTVTRPGCPERSDTMTVIRIPDNFSLGDDTVLCPGDSFVVNLSDFFTFVVWQDGSTSLNYTIDTAGTYWVRVTTPANCVWEDTLVVNLCVGTLSREVSRGDMRVFPNPFSNRFELEIRELYGREVRYRLLTVSGAEVLRDRIVPESDLCRKTIIPGDIPPGMYFLEADLGGRSKRIKLVMQ